MKKLYYRILRDFAAAQLLSALVASPKRYDYIAKKVASGELSNDEATAKNINKSLIMADQLIEKLKTSNTTDESFERS